MNFCPNCGLARAGKFCGGCGFKFEGSVESPGIQSQVPTNVNPGEFTTPQGLVFGDGFDPKKNCHNCGAKSGKSDRCAECS